MIVQCTNCSTRFDVDEEMLLPSGRKLKCSNCKEVFFQKPPIHDQNEEPDAESQPEPEPADEESLEEADSSDTEGDDDTETVLGPDLTQAIHGPSSDGIDDSIASELDSLLNDALEESGNLGGKESEELQEESDDASMDDILIDEGELQEEEIQEEELQEEEVQEEEIQEEEIQEEEVQEEEIQEEEVQEEEVQEEEVQEEEVVQESIVVRNEPVEETRGMMPTQGDAFSLESEEEKEEEEKEKKAGWTLALPQAKWGWLASLLMCLSLVAGVVVPTDWWEFTWHDLHSSFRLAELGGEWRVYPYGTVLVVQGRLNNSDKSTQLAPKIRISLLDQENKELLVSSVIPGRVVDGKLLDESSEESLRTMIGLQGDAKKVKVERLPPGQEVAFQAIFIKPPETAARYRVDFDTIDKKATGTINKP
ncbi:MAG: zinc-ribbon domain-containing protein [Magnetococcales bacterium]|nr:zinc-ribbon domain-containing protein [Magnetococcales bacterium]